jgi:hypothetical protein
LHRTIEIIVSPQGETRLETKGFTGSSCREASRRLEQALGTKAKEQLTPECYAQSTTSQQVQQGGST